MAIGGYDRGLRVKRRRIIIICMFVEEMFFAD